MRITAYTMVADGAWLTESLRSYYDLVDRIVVSYDETGSSWTGQAVDFDANLARIRALDSLGKVTYLPGRFRREGESPMHNETRQRRISLAAAGDGADWVLQLDSDEVLLDPVAFRQELERADAGGRDGLDYSARWLYAAVGPGRFLERSRRFGGIAASYPGPVAVRPEVELSLARQGARAPWHVDFRWRNTDPFRSPATHVDAVVAAEQAIAHFSWVRSETELRAKGSSSGHAFDFDWGRAVDRWLWASRHPRLTTLSTPLRRDRDLWLRTSRIQTP